METISGVFSVLLSGASLASIEHIQTIHKLELYGRGANGHLQIIAINTEGSNGEGVPQTLFTDINGYPMPQVIVQEVSLLVHTVEQSYSPSKAIYQPQDLLVDSTINPDISKLTYQPQHHEVMQVDNTINSNIPQLTAYQPVPDASGLPSVMKTHHPELRKELCYKPNTIENDKVIGVSNGQPQVVTEPVETDTTTTVTETTGSHADKSLQELLMEMLTEPTKKLKSKNAPRKSNNEAAKVYPCSLCTKVFKKEASYQGHYQTHFGSKPFTCDQCPTGFTTKWALLTHQSLHTGIKPFDCGDCGKKFRRKYDLMVHQVKHTGEKRHKCEVCHEMFKYRNQLNQHRKYTHNGEVPTKPFKCSTCEKSFSNIWKCRIHERIHSDDRPFRCDLCDRAFRQAHHLKDHMSCIHEGIRPYSCTTCSHSFSQRHKMQQHMARHMVEKPFKCDVCSKSFRQQTNLDTHKLVHLRDLEPQKHKVKTKNTNKQGTSESGSSGIKSELKKRIKGRLESQEQVNDDKSPVDCETNTGTIEEHDAQANSIKENVTQANTEEDNVAETDNGKQHTAETNNVEETKTDVHYLQTILESCSSDNKLHNLSRHSDSETTNTCIPVSSTEPLQNTNCDNDHQSPDKLPTSDNVKPTDAVPHTDGVVLPQYYSMLPVDAITTSSISTSESQSCAQLSAAFSVDGRQSVSEHDISQCPELPTGNYSPALPNLLSVNTSNNTIILDKSVAKMTYTDHQSTEEHQNPQPAILPNYDSTLPVNACLFNEPTSLGPQLQPSTGLSSVGAVDGTSIPFITDATPMPMIIKVSQAN